MPDKPASDRTEEATPEHVRKSREEGQIPQSREVPSALMVTMLLVAMALMASPLYHWFANEATAAFSFDYTGSMDKDAFASYLFTRARGALMTVAPFLVLGGAVSLFASLLVGGWAFCPKAATFKFERIDPVRGFKNLVSSRSLVNLLVSLAKLVALSWIIWAYINAKLPVLVTMRWTNPEGTLVMIGQLILGGAMRIAIALVAIAAADLAWQKWKYKRELRMTRQEVKEERKQYEVSPEIKSRIRTMQIEMARKRMLQEVPDADVVVANPTHVAVALKYDPDTMTAPRMLAKGPDILAQQIKEIAREHHIPIVHRPELARALFATTEPGEVIPDVLFVAVAEVLAMIYRMRKGIPSL